MPTARPQKAPVKYRLTTAQPTRNPVRSGATVDRSRATAAEYAAAKRSNPQNVCEKNDAALNRKNPDEASNAAAMGPLRGPYSSRPSAQRSTTDSPPHTGLTAQCGTCRRVASAS